MSKIINDSIKTHILDEANCHCTYRTLSSESSALAKCNESNIIRAYIDWQQFGDHYKINMKLPIGIRLKDKIYISDSDSIVDAKITAMFALMDNAWKN